MKEFTSPFRDNIRQKPNKQKKKEKIKGTISKFSTGSFQTLSFIKQAKEDDLMKVERERDEYRFGFEYMHCTCTIYALYALRSNFWYFDLIRERLALYDQSFEPSSIDKTFGLRGKGKLDV